MDVKNSRRLDRALEICLSGKKFSEIRQKKEPLFDILQIGLTFPKNILDKRIDERVEARLKQKMINEVKKLHKSGVRWKRLDDFGLEYRFISRYLREIYSESEMIDKLKIAIHQFAKRQMTWFRRMERNGLPIHWIDGNLSLERKIEQIHDIIKS